MKKLTILASSITTLVTPAIAFALDEIKVKRPEAGFPTIGQAITSFLTLAFAIAVLIVLVMLIIGAYEWITSGGDKEAVGKARNRIINALIGLAILAVAFALANLFARFTGLTLSNITVPTPNPQATEGL